MEDEKFTEWITRLFMEEAEILEKRALELPLTEEEAARLYGNPEEEWKRLEKRILERKTPGEKK